MNVNLNELKNIFKELVSIYSPSKNEKDVAEYIINYLKDMDLPVYLDNSYNAYGGNTPVIFTKLEGALDSSYTLSAHMDVVEPNKGVVIIEDDGKIKTDGTTTLGGDDKAGVAIILYTLKFLKESNLKFPTVYAIFTPAEEIGMLGAKNINWQEVYKNINPSKDMIVLDNGGPSKFVAHQAPTCNLFTLEVRGKKAHAGIEPEKGISSIQIISEIISKMNILRINETTTTNISKLHSEFPTNVVPDYAVAEGEVRAHSYERLDEVLDDYRKICEEICDKYGAGYNFKTNNVYPMLTSKDELNLANRFIKAYKNIGIDAKLQVIGGGSDANFFSEEGFNSIIIGVGMEKVHTTEEYLVVGEMKNSLKVLLEFFLNCN